MAQGEVDALNRVFKVTVHMKIRQALIQTGFHVRDFAVPNATSEMIHGEIRPWVVGEFRASQSADVNFQRLTVERLVEGSYFSEDFVGINGADGRPVASSMLAVSVALKSSFRSRSANGRMFWPYMGNIEGDVSNTPIFNLLNAAAQNLITRYGGLILLGQAKLVVVGKPLNGLPEAPDNPPRWTDVDALRVNPVVTALRSRKAGVGS